MGRQPEVPLASGPAADAQPPASSEPLGLIGIFDWIVTVLNAAGTAWIFVIMVLINTDVFARFLFNRPISGVPLIIEMSIIAIVFLQLAAALRGGRVTRSDVLIGRLLVHRPQLGYTLQAFYHLAGVALKVIQFVSGST